MGWGVLHRKEGVGRHGKRLFYLLRNERASPAPPPALPIYPSGGDPSPQRTRTDCTAQAAAQAVPDSRQTAHNRPHTGIHARTLDTLHRSALDTRQTTPGRSDRVWGTGWCAVCPKLCRFGHSAAVQKYISFLNTFVACATENPFTVSQKCDIIMSQD